MSAFESFSFHELFIQFLFSFIANLSLGGKGGGGGGLGEKRVRDIFLFGFDDNRHQRSHGGVCMYVLHRCVCDAQIVLTIFQERCR